jgi:hypothetical protein
VRKSQEMLAERLVSEAVRPLTATADAAAMARE